MIAPKRAIRTLTTLLRSISASKVQAAVTRTYGAKVQDRRYLGTTEAAKIVGLSKRTLQRYHRDGILEPEYVTAGGHARWDPDKIIEQLRALRKRSE
jgi:LmbE family N-acetylglucosaminyl deacetylase